MNEHLSNDEIASPFHAGEKVLQTRADKREQVEHFGRRVIRPYMPEEHREFFAQLPFVVIGSVDNDGRPWASIVAGNPGFLESPTPTCLSVSAAIPAHDPLHQSLNEGASLGVLGIELGTRRRNRMNGRVCGVNDGRLLIDVDQSFGNCPQYIQTRTVDFVNQAKPHLEPSTAESFRHLDSEMRSLIENADTFFVSSFVPPTDNPTTQGVDVSHRGGKPGFVKIDGNTLTIPDFAGNLHFNTLGNFLLNPRAGVVFPDFNTGALLMLSGSVELLWEDAAEVRAFKGAERAWRFKLECGVRLRNALPFRSILQEFSHNTLITGDWHEANAILAAEAQREQWRSFRVSRIEDESSIIRSFYLEPDDDRGLLPFNAGQFLPIRLLDKQQNLLSRTYTISSAPEESYYRLSVKREAAGHFSNLLHDTIKVGDRIEAKAPRGDFYIDGAKRRPAVLIAGGVGITPMISMAEHIAYEGQRTRYTRPLTIFHAAQSTTQRAFAQEFRELEHRSHGEIRYHSFVSQPQGHEKLGVDFNGTGRITVDVFRQALALDDYDFYLCGPGPFMQAMYDGLIELGINDSRIFAEAFGPAALERQVNEVRSHQEAAEEALIKFAQADFEQRWNKGDPTILEIAEDHGLTPTYSCRNGYCGSCATELIAGAVSYQGEPTAPHADNEVLICCAVPAKGNDVLEINL